MRHVVVTGAGGFIGGALVHEALRRGERVSAIGHGLRCLAGAEVVAIEGDVGPATLDRLPAAPDAVFHCAGGASVQASLSDPAQDFLRTVGSTRALAEWLVGNAPSARLVYPSSGAVYGEAAGHPDRRGTAPTPISPYGRHKAEAEAAVAAAGAQGLPVAIVRLFSVYGPGLRKQLFWDACRKMLTGKAEFHGSGLEQRDFVEISDAVALLRLAESAAAADAPVIDGGTGRGIAVREALSRLAMQFSPPPALRFVGTVRAGDPQHMIASPEAARALGWAPAVPLDAGLARYAAWFRGAAADRPDRNAT
jgi:UDP-glucose 4-epimerase